MEPVVVYADVRCPFAHVGVRRVHDRVRAAGGPPLRIRAWPLELVNGAPMDGAAIGHKAEILRDQVAPDLFAGLPLEPWPASSLGAMELTAAAYELDDATGEAVALAVRDAVWERGRDLSDRAVLAEVASSHGVELPPDGVHRRVEAEWAAGREAGVVGSPHFFTHGDGFFCPGLDITSDADGLHIATDAERFGAFLDEAFS